MLSSTRSANMSSSLVMITPWISLIQFDFSGRAETAREQWYPIASDDCSDDAYVEYMVKTIKSNEIASKLQEMLSNAIRGEAYLMCEMGSPVYVALISSTDHRNVASEICKKLIEAYANLRLVIDSFNYLEDPKRWVLTDDEDPLHLTSQISVNFTPSPLIVAK